jgi:hypothetical protein
LGYWQKIKSIVSKKKPDLPTPIALGEEIETLMGQGVGIAKAVRSVADKYWRKPQELLDYMKSGIHPMLLEKPLIINERNHMEPERQKKWLWIRLMIGTILIAIGVTFFGAYSRYRPENLGVGILFLVPGLIILVKGVMDYLGFKLK